MTQTNDLQHCGQLGKQANCQAAVTLSIANHHASLPIAHQLYLPKAWATDAARRRKAHVPKTVRIPGLCCWLA
jgi:SRSO17 transposase